MSFRARSFVALVCMYCMAAFTPAGATPSHRPTAARASGDSAASFTGGRTTGERPPGRNLPATPRRPEAQRAPSPSLWNPLKRRRMAMPALPEPPAADTDYAF